MSNEITNTHEIAESEWDGTSEPTDARSDMTATKEPEGGIEFFVQMRSYTKRDMEELIVEAAARMIVGKHSDDKLAKRVEERCMSLLTEKADNHLSGVTAEIIDQPLLPKYPGIKTAETPVTMREFIGLTGRAYLDARVDSSGRPTTDGYYSKTRLQHMVEVYMDGRFKAEIEKATNAAVAELKLGIKTRHDAFLEAEKARFREALAKVSS